MEPSLLAAGIDVLKQVGFPVFVACWFMFRTDKKLEDLTHAINASLGRKDVIGDKPL